MFNPSIGNYNRFKRAVQTYLNAISLINHNFPLAGVINSDGTTTKYGAVKQAYVFAASDASLAANSTTYLSPSGNAAAENGINGVCSEPGIFKNLYVKQSVAPGASQTTIYTLRKNGVDTALTCTVSGAGTTASDTTHTVAFAAGDTWSIKAVNSATAATTVPAGGITFQPDPIGNFLINSTPGTSMNLQGHGAQNNTKTDVGIFEFQLPSTYVAEGPINILINAQRVVSGGTAGTTTLGVNVYKAGVNGTHGADLQTQAVKTLTNSAADYAFAVTPTGLVAGDKLVIKITTIIQETANGGTVTGQINSVRLAAV